MEKHIQFLNMYIVATRLKNINKDNLELYWYGIWNIVLSYWFDDCQPSVDNHIHNYVEADVANQGS